MQKYLVVLKIFVLLMITGCAYYNTFYNAEQFYKKAEKEREKRIEDAKKNKNVRQSRNPEESSGTELQNYDKAIEKASKVLELYPKSKYIDDALILLGKCFYYKKEHQKAIRKFEELLENYPNSEFNHEARLWLARSHLGLEDYDQAEQSFNDIASSRAPNEIRDEALLAIGEIYFVKEDYVRAASEFRNAIKNIRDKAIRSKAAFRMGECFVKLDDNKLAIEAFDLAAKYSPDEEQENEALFKLAMCNKQLGKYRETMNYIQQLLGRQTYEDLWPIAKNEMANCIYLEGKVEQAMDWYMAITEDHSRTDGSARAYYYLAEIYKNNYAKYDSAYANYSRVSQQFSQSIMADSAKKKMEAIVELLSLMEVVKKQEYQFKYGKRYVSDYEVGLENVDESKLDDATRFKLRKARSLRRLQKWLFEYPERALPDTLVVDSLFADSLNMVDSLWVKDETGQRKQQNYYEQLDQQEFQTQLTDEERALQQKKNALENQLAPKIKALEKNDYIKNKTSLAEIFHFQFHHYDSALVHYRGILSTAPDSSIRNKKAQIIYTLAYIYKNIKLDSIRTDSLMKILAVDFATAPQGIEARKYLNMAVEEEKEDLALNAFKKAEAEYWNNNNAAQAIELYQKVQVEYPNSDYAAKALFASAWLYDNILDENDAALKIYSTLIEKYANSNFAKQAKKKVDAYNKELEKIRLAAKQDSLKALKGDSLLVQADSLKSVGDDSLKAASQQFVSATVDTSRSALPASSVPGSEAALSESERFLRTEPRRPSMLLVSRREAQKN
jgi:TolA-binding protein